MKPQHLLATAGAAALLAAAPFAHAGTLSGATSTLNGVSAVTNPPKITSAGQVLQIKHSVGVMYYGPDKNPNFTCNAKLEYSDGTPPEMVPVKYPAEGIARMRQYTKPGKYTFTLTGVANGAVVGCLGSASSSFTIENGMPASGKAAQSPAGMAMAPGAQVLLGVPALAPQTPPATGPVYGSFISKVTAVEKADAWEVTIHGAGAAPCKYHARAWSLPEMSIFKDEAMVYTKDVLAPGKGVMTVPKQGAKNVLIETVQDADDKAGNQGCLGTPKLELKPTPAAVFPPAPKKGVVVSLTTAKDTFTVGEPIPGTLKVTGDACSFVFRVRKLPFINLSDDVVFAVKTQSLVWDLNNLGQTLPAGKWTVISQPGTEALAPGELRCEIAPGAGSGQVFFTVAP